MNLDELNATALKMVRRGQGLLAADESTGTIGNRLACIGVANSEENRRDWREMLVALNRPSKIMFTGVILFEETLVQKAKDGTPLTDLITAGDSVIGIKVDKGAKPLALRPGETITEGLDGLRERLGAFYLQGARLCQMESRDQYRARWACRAPHAVAANSQCIGPLRFFVAKRPTWYRLLNLSY